MVNCHETRASTKESAYEQSVDNVDVHNNVQQLGPQVPSNCLDMSVVLVDLPESGMQGGPAASRFG